MNNHQKALRSAIEKGMMQACRDMYSFCDKPQKEFNAEYLFTVATARAIDELNGAPADPYEIRIERSTKYLERDCLKPFIKAPGTSFRRPTLFRDKHQASTIKRNGRVDIAVYSDGYHNGYPGKMPLCLIELKGFNPPRHLVLDDLRRNLEFHRLRGVTGGSVLDLSFFAALHSRTPAREATSEQAVKKQYEKWMMQLGEVSDLATQVQTFTVSKDVRGRLQEEVNEVVIDTTSRHHFIGVVVSFMRHVGSI